MPSLWVDSNGDYLVDENGDLYWCDECPCTVLPCDDLCGCLGDIQGLIVTISGMVNKDTGTCGAGKDCTGMDGVFDVPKSASLADCRGESGIGGNWQCGNPDDTPSSIIWEVQRIGTSCDQLKVIVVCSPRVFHTAARREFDFGVPGGPELVCTDLSGSGLSTNFSGPFDDCEVGGVTLSFTVY